MCKYNQEKIDKILDLLCFAFNEIDQAPELNMNNYSEDQVMELNHRNCCAHSFLKKAWDLMENLENG